MAFPIIRAAVAQLEPVWFDANATIDKSIEWMEKASREGVQLLAFPEVFIPGYPWWIWHGPLGYQSKFVAPYHENSIERNGPELKRLARAAREHRIAIVMGFSEYDRGSLYMSQATINEFGELVSVRRKLKPTHVERSVYGDGMGVDLQVHQLSFARVGALNCWEHFQPLTKYTMYSMGEQIHVASWPNMTNYTSLAHSFGPEVTHAINLSYAVEGQSFVLEAHNTISQAGVDLYAYDELSAQHLLAGGGYSRIWGPNGNSVATPLDEHEEGLLIGDLDFAEIEGARGGADAVGHYSRPDIFQLHVNRTPARHVVEYWTHSAPAERGGVHQLNGIPTTPYRDLIVDIDGDDAHTPELEYLETRVLDSGR
ncbi:carbon-nitrogen hydrolase family protein [Microbacterium sp. RD1]|uniref:carbon-nitrogen hydrolase family protein n=1 Tax=Microbacterium sp. RD1 TaxID=3457313 RepID=UPI003FA54288